MFLIRNAHLEVVLKLFNTDSMILFQEEGVCEMEGEMEGEVEVEAEYPAVIVEPVPSARMEQGFAAQVLVYDDETYLMQGVAEEQEVETEIIETGKNHTVPNYPYRSLYICHLIDPHVLQNLYFCLCKEVICSV